jgi:Uncharacterized protein conserved in bacteria (DUF2330)
MNTGRMNTRRMNLRGLAILPLVAAFVLLGAAQPAAACACGGIAPQPGDTVAVDQERAILSWAPLSGDTGTTKQERIDLRLGFDTLTSNTGLIFPTPAPARVSAGDIADFDSLEAAIAPRVVLDDDWWGGGFGASAGAPEGGGAPQVLDEVQLGPLTATTLAASDATGLSDWLATNGYVIPDAVNQLLGHYVDRGWYFVALKLTSDVALEGGLDPITFTFASDTLVYPMDLSQAANTIQQVRLYVLDQHRAAAEALETSSSYPQASVAWAGKAPAAFTDRGAYLTVLDLYLDNPQSEAADLTFADAGTDAPVEQVIHETHVVTFLGIPAGWAIVLGIVLLFVLLIVLFITLIVRLAVRSDRSGPLPPASFS